MHIKILNQADIPIYKEFRLSALQNSPESFGSSYEEEVSYTDAQWQSMLCENSIFAVFDSGNLMIAMAGLYVMTPRKFSHRGRLFGMYVNPESRGKGIAFKLLDAIAEYSKTRVVQIHLSCVVFNEAAVSLYQNYGFKIYATEPRAIKMNNKFFDDYLMILELR